AVAELVPLPTRPRTISWQALMEEPDRWQADPALKQELAGLLPETTDDVPA
ncbi:MAG TPA: prevent-host-death family protein, partial [Acidimicrobiaceae bacterium]|nr:prevent-host-death family protein [Acidimicrobiaceae bacterium]